MVKSDEQVLKDNAEFGSGGPGVSPDVCDHPAAKRISVIGSDTWGLESYDFAKGAPESIAYCHINLIVRRGISNFENLDLDELSAAKAYQFLFAWAPLKLVGATGSPGNSIAAYCVSRRAELAQTNPSPVVGEAVFIHADDAFYPLRRHPPG